MLLPSAQAPWSSAVLLGLREGKIGLAHMALRQPETPGGLIKLGLWRLGIQHRQLLGLLLGRLIGASGSKLRDQQQDIHSA
jgi:hypothetical protein